MRTAGVGRMEETGTGIFEQRGWVELEKQKFAVQIVCENSAAHHRYKRDHFGGCLAESDPKPTGRWQFVLVSLPQFCLGLSPISVPCPYVICLSAPPLQRPPQLSTPPPFVKIHLVFLLRLSFPTEQFTSLYCYWNHLKK